MSIAVAHTGVVPAMTTTVTTARWWRPLGSTWRTVSAVCRAGAQPVIIDVRVDDRDDHSGARIRATVHDRLRRLGIEQLPVVHLHDPAFHPFDLLTESGGAVDTLVELRSGGEIGAIGVAGADPVRLSRYVDLGVLDAVRVHGRWTLVDRSAGPLIDRAAAAGLTVVNTGVFGGGLLGSVGAGAAQLSRSRRPELAAAARAMGLVCRWWGTDLATAALLFSVRDHRVDSTVTGLTTSAALSWTREALESDLVEPFWDELETLVPATQHHTHHHPDRR
ncbi:MAG TPA: aldo/keto reductase [Microlunatus sp.]